MLKSKPAKSPKPLKAKPATPINVKPYEPEAPGARKWRNRIVGHDEVDAKSLLANPKNWRINPKNQVDALAGVLAERWAGCRT